MKGLLISAIILVITMSALYITQVGSCSGSNPKGYSTLSNNRGSIKVTSYHSTLTNKKYLEEPVGAVNQAGNIIFPALKMHQ